MIHRAALCFIVAFVGFVQFASAADKILEMGAKDWKYQDDVEALPENWNSPDLDDSKWKSGQAPLGYGDDDIKQKVSFGDDETNKRPVAFFRRTVEVEDPNAYKKVLGKLVCDDGSVVYVNGKEVHRFNLPEGEIKNTSRAKFAMGGELERYGLSFLIDTDKLKAGKNVIAVRVHQANPNSSDLALDMSLEGLTDEASVEEADAKFKEEAQYIKQMEEGQF
jgi:hypothetical protein